MRRTAFLENICSAPLNTSSSYPCVSDFKTSIRRMSCSLQKSSMVVTGTGVSFATDPQANSLGRWKEVHSGIVFSSRRIWPADEPSAQFQRCTLEYWATLLFSSLKVEGLGSNE